MVHMWCTWYEGILTPDLWGDSATAQSFIMRPFPASARSYSWAKYLLHSVLGCQQTASQLLMKAGGYKTQHETPSTGFKVQESLSTSSVWQDMFHEFNINKLCFSARQSARCTGLHY